MNFDLHFHRFSIFSCNSRDLPRWALFFPYLITYWRYNFPNFRQNCFPRNSSQICFFVTPSLSGCTCLMRYFHFLHFRTLFHIDIDRYPTYENRERRIKFPLLPHSSLMFILNILETNHFSISRQFSTITEVKKLVKNQKIEVRDMRIAA